MKTAVLGVILAGLIAAPSAEAQGRGRGSGKVPPGHLPPPGECRVWYDGVPPGRQPAPTSCREAERIASRTRNARVIYGEDRGRYSDRDRLGNRYPDDRYPGRYPDDRYPGRYPDERTRRDEGRRPNDGGRTTGRAVPRDPGDVRRFDSIAAENGYRDGLNKGREDLDDRDRYDPNRHSWYRSGDRGYTSRYGSRDSYRAEYRRGFVRGYDDAYYGRQPYRR